MLEIKLHLEVATMLAIRQKQDGDEWHETHATTCRVLRLCDLTLVVLTKKGDMISHAFDLFTCCCRQQISERYLFSAVQIVDAV